LNRVRSIVDCRLGYPVATSLLALLLTLCGRAWATDGFELGGYRYSADRLTQWALPSRLREVSGLTLDPAGRLFAHDDEVAVVYQLDYQSGRIIKAFALGSPPQRGDFEGIAWVDGRIYLTTSDGDLLVAEEGRDGAFLPYQRYVTDLGKRCEIEGLYHDTAARLLRFACKTVREPGTKNRTLVLAWSLETESPAPDHDVELSWPSGEAADATADHLIGDGRGTRRRLRLSGLTRSPGNGNFIAVAARQHALVEFEPDGVLVRAFQIPNAHHHPQMEGVTMTTSGDLIIADEGGKNRGRLSVYAAER
jgi:uncharacterized protein YjiK